MCHPGPQRDCGGGCLGVSEGNVREVKLRGKGLSEGGKDKQTGREAGIKEGEVVNKGKEET